MKTRTFLAVPQDFKTLFPLSTFRPERLVRPDELVFVGIDSWMPLVVRHSLEKCFSNAKNVVY
jgi:hypothetical protein